MFKEDKQSRRLRQADAEYVAAVEAGAFPRGPRPRRLLEIYQAIHSGDPEQQLIGCKLARKISSERLPHWLARLPHDLPIDAIIESGILSKCVKLLKKSDHETQLEVVLLVTNIALSTVDHLKHLVELGVLHPLVQLVNSEHLGVIEKAIVALKCIASDCAYTRELVLNSGVVTHLASHTQSLTSPITLLRRISSLLFTLCFGGKKPSLQKLEQILLVFENLLKTTDVGVISDTCGALSRLVHGSNRILQEVLNADRLLGQLMQNLFLTENLFIVSDCLHAIEHLLSDTRNKKQVNRLMDAGPLIQILGQLMKSTEGSITQNALWIVARFISDTPEQIDRVINGGLVPTLCKVIQTRWNEAKGYALWAIWNISHSGTEDHRAYMSQNGVISTMCHVFTMENSGHVLRALQILRILLDSAGEDAVKTGEYRKAVEECGGLGSMKQLLIEHFGALGGNGQVYQTAYEILSTYFPEVQEVDQNENDTDSDVDDADVKPAKAQKLE